MVPPIALPTIACGSPCHDLKDPRSFRSACEIMLYIPAATHHRWRATIHGLREKKKQMESRRVSTNSSGYDTKRDSKSTATLIQIYCSRSARKSNKHRRHHWCQASLYTHHAASPPTKHRKITHFLLVQTCTSKPTIGDFPGSHLS